MEKLKNAIKTANAENALHLIGESSQQAPLKTGFLRSKGDFEIINDGLTMVVEYSAKDKNGFDYAAIQHEDLTFHHENGNAKFLENPFDENLNIYIDNIIEKIKGVL